MHNLKKNQKYAQNMSKYVEICAAYTPGKLQSVMFPPCINATREYVAKKCHQQGVGCQASICSLPDFFWCICGHRQLSVKEFDYFLLTSFLNINLCSHIKVALRVYRRPLGSQRRNPTNIGKLSYPPLVKLATANLTSTAPGTNFGGGAT